jgi:hypothetical protein
MRLPVSKDYPETKVRTLTDTTRAFRHVGRLEYPSEFTMLPAWAPRTLPML